MVYAIAGAINFSFGNKSASAIVTLIIDIAGAVLGLFIMANPFDIPNMIVRIIGVVLVVNAVLAFYSMSRLRM